MKVKGIPGFESTHVVSEDGTVTVLERVVRQDGHPTQKLRKTKPRTLRPASNGKGYQMLYLISNGEKKRAYVHRLVAEAFLANPNHLPQVNHKDGNKNNNQASNLEWVTCKENVAHAIRTGLSKSAIKKAVK